jgi:hypothetical protein
MSELKPARTNTSRRAHFDTQAPIMISRDDLRQDPAGGERFTFAALVLRGPS